MYSSSEAFTEEQEIDFVRLGRWLDYFDLEPAGFKIVEEDRRPRPRFEEGFHASGHASHDDIVRMVNEVDPDVIIPVHTERPDWFKRFEKNRLTRERETSLFLKIPAAYSQ